MHMCLIFRIEFDDFSHAALEIEILKSIFYIYKNILENPSDTKKLQGLDFK